MKPLDREFLTRFARLDTAQEEAVMALTGIGLNLRQIKDVAERVIATYLQVFLGLWMAAGPAGLDFGAAKSAAVAAAPAALSALKGWLAVVLPVGDDSASMLP